MAYDSGLQAADIQEIFDTGLSTDALNTWIAAAEARVDDLPEHDDLDSARKKEITRFLAPAMATAQDPRVDEERHEAATVSYQGEHMRYIEVAASLDPTGNIGADQTDTATIGTLTARSFDGDAPGA